MRLKKHSAPNTGNRLAAACLLSIPMLLASFLVPLLLCITIPPLAAGIIQIMGSIWYVISMLLFSVGSGYWVYKHKHADDEPESELNRERISATAASDDYVQVAPRDTVNKKSEGHPHI